MLGRRKDCFFAVTLIYGMIADGFACGERAKSRRCRFMFVETGAADKWRVSDAHKSDTEFPRRNAHAFGFDLGGRVAILSIGRVSMREMCMANVHPCTE